jgi:hypothetical protein
VKLAEGYLPFPCYQVGVEMTFSKMDVLDKMLLKLIPKSIPVGDVH